MLQGHSCIVKMHGACVSDHVRVDKSVCKMVGSNFLSMQQPFIVLEFAPLSLEKGKSHILKPHKSTTVFWGRTLKFALNRQRL